jgi:hypothetical protein
MLGPINPNAAPAGWRATGAPSIPAPVQATLAASPAAASPPAISAPPSTVPDSSLLGRLFKGVGDAAKGFDDWRKDNRYTLMALGAGMAGAQNLGQGLNRGMTMAVPAMEAGIKQQQLNQSIPVLRDRLMKQNGMSATEATQTAMAAATNPAIMQQLLPSVIRIKTGSTPPVPGARKAPDGHWYIGAPAGAVGCEHLAGRPPASQSRDR